MRSSTEQYEILAQGIRDHAREMRNIKGKKFGVLFAKEGDQIVGGVGYTIYLGSLQIEKLWGAKEKRGQGLAQRLMDEVESEGIKQGCRFATLSTMDWEALDFYLKNNYVIEFKRDGYTVHHHRLQNRGK